jgi:hypothetical protein
MHQQPFDPAKCTWDLQNPPVGAPCNDPLEGDSRYSDNPALNILKAELEYPSCKGQKNAVRVSLMDVRVADDLLIVYDFDRDGWSIRRDIHAQDKQTGRHALVLARNVEVCFIPAYTGVDVCWP